MGKALEITIGDEFDRLTVVGEKVIRIDGSGRPRIYYPCRCSCDGNVREYRGTSLGRYTRSCGCYSRERSYKHGDSHSRLHNIWCGIRTRCKDHPDYGARGIGLCDEWQDFEAFRAWSLANGYRGDLTIERRDVNGDYAPDNCEWIPRGDQNRNTRQNRRVEAFGETKILADWARDPRCAVRFGTLWYRIEHGWEPERAILTPISGGPPDAKGSDQLHGEGTRP